MLTLRRSAITLLVTAVIGVSTPGAVHADSASWISRLGQDFRTAQAGTNGKGVTVAVLSSGVDPSVRTLAGALRHGRDFVDGSAGKRIDGTLLASLLVGGGPSADPRLSIHGLAPGVGILPVRIAPDSEDSIWDTWRSTAEPTDAMIQGIRYAADQGAGVILVAAEAWGNVGSAALEDAVDHAEARGAVIVAINAPAGSSAAPFPAAVPGVIGVATLDTGGDRWAKYSVQASSTLVAAPGFRLTATGPGNRIYRFWGAPPAAAFVAATAALLKSRFPRLTPDQVTEAITTSARHPRGGYNAAVGFGTIDPADALKAAQHLTDHPDNPTATAIPPDSSHYDGLPPAPIAALPPDTTTQTLFWSLIAAGLLIIVAITIIAFRQRRPSPTPDPPVAQPGKP